MARVTGPSRTELDARGDEFAARVTRAIRTTLRTVAPTTYVVDDLVRIQTVWRSVVKNSLAPHLRKQWDAAVLGVRGQLEKIAARDRETLLAAGFEIPKVSNPLAETFMSEATNRLVAIGDVVWYTARGEMLTGLQLGEGVAELRERVKASVNVSSKRAEVIARTEVNSAMNNGAYQQMKVLDVPTTKEWIATSDSRTRESHEEVDGEEIAGDAKFMVGGYPMDHPHDLNGPPSETISCRCTLAWEIDDDDDYWDGVAYVAALVSAGDFDEAKHKRDNKGRFAKKAGSGAPKVGKKLKVTHGIVHKKHEPGTIIAVSGSDSKRVVWDGNKYLLQEKQANGGWVTTNTAIKSKAYVEIGKFDDDWREPSDNDEDKINVDPGITAPTKGLKPGMTIKKPGQNKAVNAPGASLKITHGLVHSKHEPGDVIAENGTGDKRVIWDGSEYRLQRKTDDGNWTTDKSVKKSKAYVEINAYDSDWREPNQVEAVPSAPAPSSQPGVVKTTPSPTPAPSLPPSVTAPNAVISEVTPTDGYAKVGVNIPSNNKFKDPDGNEWLLNSYPNANLAKSRVFGAHLYSTLGIKTAQTDLVKLDEKNFPKIAKRVGTREFAVKGITDPSELDNTISFDSQLRKQLWDGFAMDLWLGNRDVAAYDNITVDQDNNLIRGLDGIFGANSTFSEEITEDDMNQMLSPYQGTTGGYATPEAKPSAFVSMPSSHIIEGTRKIASLSSEDIDKLVEDMGFGPVTSANLALKLKSRRASLIKLVENTYGAPVSSLPTTPQAVSQVGPTANVPTVSAPALATPEPSSSGLDLLTMDGLTKVKPYKNGGIFKNASGSEYFVKPVPSVSHMNNQQLAANLYLFTDAKAETPIFVELDKEKLKTSVNTNIAVQTEYDSSGQSITEAIKSNPKTRQQVYESFAIDAWLGNWDVVGLGYENLTVDKNGDVKRTNLGGSLLYRANGEPKGNAFGDTVSEIDLLRDPHKNPSSAKIFADVTDDDIRAGVAKIESISPTTIDFLVDQSGVTGEDAKLLKQKLKARRQDLINKYGSDAPKPAQPDGPAASTQPTATNALGGTTKTYTAAQKAKVKTIFEKHDAKWFNSTHTIYNAAHEVSTTHPDLTMADALDIMDQSLKKKTGNPFRTKVEKWLKTKVGKDHALFKGGSASLGGTAPKTPGTTAQAPSLSTGSGYQQLSKPTASALQNQMNQATPPPWTANQRQSLTTYTGGSYSTINKCARGTAPCDPTTKKTLDEIKSAMKPSTANVRLYRATNANSFGIASGDDFEALVGKTISDNGVISTSITKIGWSGKVLLDIEVPKGTHMAWVQPISYHPSENEMVLAPGTHFEVVSYEKVVGSYDTQYKVKLRVIPGSDTRSRELKEQQKELVSA